MPYFNFNKNTYEALPDLFWKKQAPRSFNDPNMIVFNHKLATQLGIDTSLEKHPHILASGGMPSQDHAQPTMEINNSKSAPEYNNMLLTMAYAGYQFGHFSMLGDGRAALIGEHITPKGERYDIQLKGLGTTPFSRRGDGMASLSPMLREYIVSEFLAATGIPTSRSLSVVTTGESVYRTQIEPGAVLTRIAKSHVRIGTFNYAHAYGQLSDIRALADYAILRHYPELLSPNEELITPPEQNTPDIYLSFFRKVVSAQAKLIAQWQCIGFLHGVMNTDNTSISGESLDFGPCAFLDTYDPRAVFSSIDINGRYAYQNQPSIMLWNLARFAEALLPLFDNDQNKAVILGQKELATFMPSYNDNYLNGMRAKLGLLKYKEEKEDTSLIQDLLNIMKVHKLDYTNTFIELLKGEGNFFELEQSQIWLSQWHKRLDSQTSSNNSRSNILELAVKNNPKVIPRNHLMDQALTLAEKGNMESFYNLLTAIQNPYNSSPNHMEPPEPSYQCVTYCGT